MRYVICKVIRPVVFVCMTFAFPIYAYARTGTENAVSVETLDGSADSGEKVRRWVNAMFDEMRSGGADSVPGERVYSAADGVSYSDFSRAHFQEEIDRTLSCLHAETNSLSLVYNALLAESLIGRAKNVILPDRTRKLGAIGSYAELKADIASFIGESRYGKLREHFSSLLHDKDAALRSVAMRALVRGLGDDSSKKLLRNRRDKLHMDYIRAMRKDSAIERKLVSAAEALAYLSDARGIPDLEKTMCNAASELGLRFHSVEALLFLGKLDVVLKSGTLECNNMTLAYNVFDELPDSAWNRTEVVAAALRWILRIGATTRGWAQEERLFLSFLSRRIKYDRAVAVKAVSKSELDSLRKAVRFMAESGDSNMVSVAEGLFFFAVSPEEADAWMAVQRKLSSDSASYYLLHALADCCPPEILARHRAQVMPLLDAKTPSLRDAALIFLEHSAGKVARTPRTAEEFKARRDAIALILETDAK